MRTTPPPVAPAAPWSFPAATEQVLPNGLRVWTYHLPGQQVITASVAQPIPLTAEPRDLEGVAVIASRTIDEGSREHPGISFAETLETEGAELTLHHGYSGLAVAIDVPASRFPIALGLLAESLISPQISDQDIARHAQLRLSEIEQIRANGAQLASTRFRSALYADSERLARMNGGEPATVAGLTGAAARDFHAAYYGPEGATLILAGDFSSIADLPGLIASAGFADWSGPATRVPLPAAARAADPARILIDRPGAVQADVRLGAPAIDRADPRWVPFTVAVHAVGGAFWSRLNRVLREERGYTYGVHLARTAYPHGGQYTFSGSFRTEVTAAAIAEARELLVLGDQPITAEEVATAVNYHAGISPLRYATAGAVADQATDQALAGLGPDYLTGFLAALREVTPAQATEAYNSLVDVDAATLVVVGDGDALTEELRAGGPLQVEPVPT
ncbi:M16 family metallopeptidase [Granulicoccus phenolivorans]|uniref:M16 family metallopeptidase n=1 Tax=Granulicoccus phenolivorans TaxID=266854 RepID=UPI00041F1A8C|nr:pitrilysin family protein [Granulicoccus phenolivorans]